MSLHSDLLCRNGCGFYGNPEWQWFCSKCWREHQWKHGSPSKPTRGLLSPADSPATSPKTPEMSSPRRVFVPTSSSSKSARRQTMDKNIKQLFGSRMVNKESPEKSPKQRAKSRPELPKEAKEVSTEFAAFLNKKLDKIGITDVSKNVKGMVEKILNFQLSSPENVDDLAAMVQEFNQLFQRRIETKQLYKSLTDEDRTLIMDYAEKYIMVCCYKHLFCPSVTSDEEKDLEVQSRIRSLSWISTEHLNCSIDEFSQDVRDLLYQSINDLLEMDGKMAPQDKMACLVKCSKGVFEMLKLSNEKPASADDFLPCLIYICLMANPPRIQSNINYITRFCNENRLRMGEGGYFFANLCCALSFIENMKAESVNMDTDEFERYITGQSVPLESWRSNLLMCDGLQVMSQNLKTLGELRTKQEAILRQAKDLHADMEKFSLDIDREVEATLERTQYTLKKWEKEPVGIDTALDGEAVNLPSPLLPDSKSCDSQQPKLLEDYAGNSDSLSLLSLDFSSAANSAEQPASTYRGFSVQSSKIPSISCDAGLPSTAPFQSKKSPVSSTDSTESALKTFETASLSSACDSGDTAAEASKPASFSSTGTVAKTSHVGSAAASKADSSSSEENLASSTASSSPLISAAESASSSSSPALTAQAESEQPAGSGGVISGIIDTFDSLL